MRSALGLAAAVVVVALAPRSAAARPMPHRDLAGLVMESDAVVVAERVSVEHPARYSEIGHYRVERALFGTMAKGMEVAVEQSLYATGRHNLDKRAVLFLVKGELVPSGMRVIEGGKVFRFEQFDNPGGWGMVPQGHDPQDNWQAGVAAVDLPTFEREVSDAVARVNAFATARGIADRDPRRAAMLALLVPPGGPHATGGFYVDELARGIEQELVKAGDLEGGLLAFERDRSVLPAYAFANLADLVAVATDRKRPLDLRVAAMQVVGSGLALIGDAAATHAMIAVLGDPSPVVRAAAVAVVSPAHTVSSDPEEQARFAALERDQRAALMKLYATETDGDVLFVLLEVLDQPTGRRGGPDVVAHADLFGDDIRLAVRCARPDVKVTAARLVGPDVPGARIELTCGDHVDSGLGGTAPTQMVAAGRHPLTVEVTVAGGKTTTLALGTLVANGDGELLLER
jgi:hypothetical protein